jgi:hypothetical protein
LPNFSSNLLSICYHEGVTTVQFSHDMAAEELRVTVDVKPLDPELGGNAHAVDECLVFCHIVDHAEV